MPMRLTQRDNFTSLLFAWKIFKKSRRESFTSNIVINPRNYVVSRVLFCAENCLFGDGSRQVDNTIKYFITVEKYEYKTVKDIVFIKLIINSFAFYYQAQISLICHFYIPFSCITSEINNL
jgi:hypothetical protein